MRIPFLILAIVGLLAVPALAPAADAGPLLAKIKAVGKEGNGNVEAARAWQELVKLGPTALLETLAALDDADPTAANWLRSAVDTIADHEIEANRPLPTNRLEAFVKDIKHSGAARRLAYEWLVRVDASTPGRLLPGMLNDPGQEMRRDAVALVIKDADKLLDKGDKESATAAFKRALTAARDRDQVDLVADRLKKQGIEVDLPAHFGFIQRWLIAGPFDNHDKKGFAAVYPPEKQVNLDTTFAGKEDAKFRWLEHVSKDPYGAVDLNKFLGKNMGVVAYAFAAVESPKEQQVEIRAATPNAVKLFLNGKQVFFREEYHHGNNMDAHIGRGTLKAGRNEILIKICQNEQKDAWAQEWRFQLRICDAIGGAVPLKVLSEKPAEAK